MKWFYDPPPHRKQVLIAYVPVDGAESPVLFAVGHYNGRWYADLPRWKQSWFRKWTPIVWEEK